MHYETVFYMIR